MFKQELTRYCLLQSIHNSQTGVTSQVSLNSRMDRQNGQCPYNGILFRKKGIKVLI